MNRAFLTPVAGFVCFVLPAILVTGYTLDHFYAKGGFVWDSGLFAYFSVFADQWPMLWPDFLHRDVTAPRTTFFSVHFMPIFYLASALHALVPSLTPAAYLALLQGLWTGMLGLAAFMLCGRASGLGLAIATGLATALSGPMLAAMGLPHTEMAIPALLALFFVLRAAGHRVAAYVALALCLSIREDAGLHAAAYLILLVLAQLISRVPREDVRANLVAVAVCLCYAAGALALQHFVYPGSTSSLQRVLLGSPAGAHWTWQLIARRGPTFLVDWGYAVWPPLILMGVALWRRSSVLFAGGLAPIPWILFTLLMVPESGLTSYYGFPLVITVAWPTMALPYDRFAVRLQLALATASIVLFAAIGGPNHDRAPWRSFFFSNFAAVGHYETVLRDAVSRRGELGRLMLDDAVTSLVPEAAELNEWTLQWAVDRLPNPDVVIYMQGGRDWNETAKVIAASGLTHTCRIADTPFMVASRNGTSLCRQNPG